MTERMRVACVFVAAMVGVCASPVAGAADFSVETIEKLREAMALENRPEEDRARDQKRKPIATSMFLRLRDDMRVLELFPGGGWYTRLLAPVLEENGELFVALGTARVEELADEIGKLEVLAENQLVPTARYGIYELAPFEFEVDGIDLVVTYRNLHNLTPNARGNLFAAAFKALKPGGLLGTLDHTRRHMEPDNVENRRRIDPVMVIVEATAAGFRVVDYSDLHYIPDDELRYEVGRDSVAGNTDRFTLLFEKPR